MPVKDQSELIKRFGELTKLKYAEQAKVTCHSDQTLKNLVDIKWLLGGMYLIYSAAVAKTMPNFLQDGLEKEAENVWKFAHKFIEIDPRKKVTFSHFRQSQRVRKAMS
jgi:hypothetical protein